MHLTSRIKRLLLFDDAVDTPELEELRRFVTPAVEAWLGGTVKVNRIGGCR